VPGGTAARRSPNAWVRDRRRRGAGWPRRCWPDPALVAEPAQLTVDATIAPGRVLPGQPQHQRADLPRGTRTATSVWVAPAAPDQLPMPAQQRLGPDERPVPAQARQQPHQSSQHGSVCPIHPRSGHRPPQYRDLVAQHEQLGVLGGRTPRQQGKPRHHLAEHQVDQSQDHAGDHRGPVSSPTNSQLSTHDRVSGTHTLHHQPVTLRVQPGAHVLVVGVLPGLLSQRPSCAGAREGHRTRKATTPKSPVRLTGGQARLLPGRLGPRGSSVPQGAPVAFPSLARGSLVLRPEGRLTSPPRRGLRIPTARRFAVRTRRPFWQELQPGFPGPATLAPRGSYGH
jgi:hypothetical protein